MVFENNRSGVVHVRNALSTAPAGAAGLVLASCSGDLLVNAGDFMIDDLVIEDTAGGALKIQEARSTLHCEGVALVRATGSRGCRVTVEQTFAARTGHN